MIVEEEVFGNIKIKMKPYQSGTAPVIALCAKSLAFWINERFSVNICGM